MDVRCEKCLTVYDFDEAQVGEAGVTVKCTQCGHLFKVRRRPGTAEYGSSSGSGAGSGTPSLTPTAPPPPPRPRRDDPERAPDEEDVEQPWMVRIVASGEVRRFRALTTLQQWIVEQKVHRDDEISRGGGSWKRLGGIAELASFFHVVEQAAQVARSSDPEEAAAAAHAAYLRTRPGEDDPALTATAPIESGPVGVVGEPSGPMVLGALPEDDAKDPAFAATGKQPHLRGSAGADAFSEVSTGEVTELDLPRQRRRRGPVLAGWLAVAALVAVAAYLGVFKRDAIKALVWEDEGRGREAYRQGREYFLLDTDDAFRRAAQAFERAHGADGANALPLAGLAEVNTTWAWYLAEEARVLDAAGQPSETAARMLRKQAKAHLDDAKRYAGEALALSPEEPAVNRAMGDFLRVDGAPAVEVERYLRRTLDKQPDDPEAWYVGGALLYREGKVDEARTKLERANQLNGAATQHGLLRAHFLLALIAAANDQRDLAGEQIDRILAANEEHERALALRALLAAADGGVAGTGSDPVAALAPVEVSAAAPVAAAPVAPAPTAPVASDAVAPASAGAHAAVADKPGDYDKLVAQADRLSENGRAGPARKLYDRALSLQPRGLEALTGLAYCDLDGEKFMQAIDHFKQVLSISPNYGEALIGLAEAYKIRGDRANAAEYYRRYLRAQPGGPKASMAQKNLRDLEPKAPAPERPVQPEAAVPARDPSTNEEGAAAEATSEPAPAEGSKTELPRPPPPTPEDQPELP